MAADEERADLLQSTVRIHIPSMVALEPSQCHELGVRIEPIGTGV